eukprot:CAMPEP_0181494624 /NCGR_PEP_ID=MMETSP1110-20121109/51879_1 /TAXON_ID=174948 /ORGANISM="Symbiodinium sp., Strain CCMP421" /LENGTH=140 /DNA_ID=CAMNT_0023622065 /DNA_START=311 /DNA_END=732 /DNA_ORIENTATION=+
MRCSSWHRLSDPSEVSQPGPPRRSEPEADERKTRDPALVWIAQKQDDLGGLLEADLTLLQVRRHMAGVLRTLLSELVDTITDGLDLERFLPCFCGKVAEAGVTTTCLRAGLACRGGVDGFCGLKKDVMEAWIVAQDLGVS